MLLVNLMKRMKVTMNFMKVSFVKKKCLLNLTWIMRMVRIVRMMKYWKQMSNQGTGLGQSCRLSLVSLCFERLFVYQNTVSIQAEG